MSSARLITGGRDSVALISWPPRTGLPAMMASLGFRCPITTADRDLLRRRARRVQLLHRIPDRLPFQARLGGHEVHHFLARAALRRPRLLPRDAEGEPRGHGGGFPEVADPDLVQGVVGGVVEAAAGADAFRIAHHRGGD